MNKLIELGFKEEDLKNMIYQNPSLSNLTNQEIENNIFILQNLNCNEAQIRNIVIANPFYLNRSVTDLKKLIIKLFRLGLTNLNLLFDSNPFFLNFDSFEIDEFIEKKEKQGMSLDKIVDLIDSNPYIVDEF